MNRSADAWKVSETEAKSLAETLIKGDYVYQYKDCPDEQSLGYEGPYSEQTIDELRKALSSRGFALETDDRGLRVVEAETI